MRTTTMFIKRQQHEAINNKLIKHATRDKSRNTHTHTQKGLTGIAIAGQKEYKAIKSHIYIYYFIICGKFFFFLRCAEFKLS